MGSINYINYMISVFFAIFSAFIITIILGNNLRNEKLKKSGDKESNLFSINKNDSFKSKFNNLIEIFKSNIFAFIGFSVILIFLNLAVTKNLSINEIYNAKEINIFWIEKMLVFPILMLVFAYDMLKKRIPNRYSITILEIAVIATFILSTINIIHLKVRLIGMGAAILILGLMYILSKLLFGRDSIGMGDIKVLVPLGAVFGISSFIDILIVSYALVLAGSILITIYAKFKKKKISYVPFMPFLIISIFICLNIEAGTIMKLTANTLNF